MSNLVQYDGNAADFPDEDLPGGGGWGSLGVGFVPGAESHEISGHRMLSTVIRPSTVEPSAYLTAVVAGAQWILNHCAQTFKV